MTKPAHTLGIQGEALIAQQLISQGFTILATNYRKMGGEIDLIAKKTDVMIFVEVKTRNNPLFDMAEIITPSKQRKIITTAKMYMAEHKVYDYTCQFDVALISWNDNHPEVNYIENAFTER